MNGERRAERAKEESLRNEAKSLCCAENSLRDEFGVSASVRMSDFFLVLRFFPCTNLWEYTVLMWAQVMATKALISIKTLDQTAT